MTTIQRMMATLPKTFRKMVVTKLSNNFREATVIQNVPFPDIIKDDQVVVKNRYLGVNASDVNAANGLGGYNDGKPPFDIGFESIGEVASVGSGVKHLSPGQPVAVVANGTYSEYQVVPAKYVVPVPDLNPDFLGLGVSALTAELAYQTCAPLKAGQKVLVTAAAGGTGQFAVQLAKLAGCHVIGTCSTDAKAEFLKSLGCDRPINYKTEDFKEVLKTEYKEGIDVIYESVGGAMFDNCVNALAPKGHLIVIGAISGYSYDAKPYSSSVLPRLPLTLLLKSASVHGFFLFQYMSQSREALARLMQMYIGGQLKVGIDNGKNSPTGNFVGLESTLDAVDYMYSGRNEGKIYVQLGDSAKL